MSFKVQPASPSRPNRCQLFGPGSRPEILPKMATSAADVINLDLEDSVSPNDKAQARKNIIDAIGDIDWGTKTLSVRINGLDTPYWYRDVVDLLENASERLDQIMIPKVGCAGDIYAVDALVTAIEAAKGRTKRVSFEVIIESAAGIAHAEEIAAASPRMQAMSLGAADFAASMGMQTTGIGGTQDNYYMLQGGNQHWSDPWHWAQAKIVAAARTHGVLPVDGPFGDFSDDDGFRAQARRSAVVATREIAAQNLQTPLRPNMHRHSQVPNGVALAWAHAVARCAPQKRRQIVPRPVAVDLEKPAPHARDRLGLALALLAPNAGHRRLAPDAPWFGGERRFCAAHYALRSPRHQPWRWRRAGCCGPTTRWPRPQAQEVR